MKSKLLAATVLVAIIAAVWLGWHRSTGRHERAGDVRPESRRPETAAVDRRNSVRPPAAAARDRSGPQSGLVSAESNLPVTEPVQLIVAGQAEYAKREAAVETISTNLTQGDSEALRAYLLRPDPADSNPGGQAFKNQVLNAVGSLKPPPAWLEDTLVAIYRDRRQDVVLRDYAVQHLGEYLDQLGRLGLEDSETGARVQTVLWEALSETDSSIAGTALLALETLSQRRPEFDRDRIAGAAFRMARSEGTGELARITAFQVCGRMEVKEILPQLLESAHNGQTTTLRISAVAMLGTLGNEQTKPVLLDLINGREPRLKLPAEQALHRIEQREQAAKRPKG